MERQPVVSPDVVVDYAAKISESSTSGRIRCAARGRRKCWRTVSQDATEAAGKNVDWAALIQAASNSQPDPVSAETYIKKWGTASKPIAVSASDGNIYVVKGQQAGRMIVNDHIAGRLGLLVGAPVPPVALVEISEGFVKATPEMAHVATGLAHGSRFLRDCTERINDVDHLDANDNRSRFARLALFFGWVGGSDHQFIYDKAEPHRVHSVDHSHFFHGGPDWTIDKLGQAPAAAANDMLMKKCQLTKDELIGACRSLRAVTDDQIAEIVAGPPDEWGITIDERVAAAHYLATRRDQLVAAHQTNTRKEPAQ